MSCLISVVSVAGMSSLFFIGTDRADPMPSKNERQGRSTNIFFFHEGSLQGQTPENDGACVETVARQFALRLPPQQMIFHAFTNFQFDFVLRGCGFTAEFRPFDRVPG